MPHVKANGIHIAYDTFGAKSASPILLLSGLSCQMICWDEALCQQLAAQGFFVIRCDNRDIGLSQNLDERGVPHLAELFTAALTGGRLKVPYTLEDMADDCFGLLDALGIESAHFCGFSMGGMIAQTASIRNPSRVISLTSIYSTTGDPMLATPTPEAQKVLITPPPRELGPFIEHFLLVHRTLSGPGFPFDEAWHRKIGENSFKRSSYTKGVARQFAAIIASGDRTRFLRTLEIPTLVIHGTDDPLIPVICGKETAKAIPDSKLMLIPGMGHDLPHNGAWPGIIDAVSKHAKQALMN
jgi:pimeloyl-ACP methyl ester carboxylesterase